MPVPLIAAIGAGAGALAKAVGGLFSGEAKARRQARRAARKAKRASKKEAKELEKAIQEVALGGTPLGEPFLGIGDVPGGGPATPASPRGAKTDIMQLLKDNWIIVAIAALVLFGPKLFPGIFKPKRRAPRRRAPKVVTRYRTRKAPVRRRK